MEFESQSLEQDDESSSDEGEDWCEDKRVNTKLPSMRITKMKLKFEESDSNTGGNAPTSGEEHIKNLLESWRENHDIRERNLDKHFRDTIHRLPGHFTVKVISRHRTVQSEISRVVNSFVDTELSTDTPTSKTEDIIIFLWRELRAKSDPLLKYPEIFVLTSGSAFHLIQEDDRDDEFPKLIARRVLQFNLKTLSSKQLTGPHTSQARTYRVDEGTHLSFWDYLGHITTSYNMPLRTDASLFRLPCFQKKYGRPGSLSVTVGVDYLKFNMKMSMKDIVAGLLQFSRISRGMETLIYLKDVAETDDANFDIFEQVTVVKGKRFAKKHNKILCEILQNFLDKATRVDMLLTHKNLEKWHSANQFSLQKKAAGSKRYETLKVWHGSPPAIKEIFESTQPQASRIDIKTLFLEFHDNSSEITSKIRAPLLDLVEGHFKTEDGMSLFRYCGQWLQINNEYMTHLEMEFREIMNSCCLRSTILPLPWPYSGKNAPEGIKCKPSVAKRPSVPTTKEKFKKWYKQIWDRNCKYSTDNDVPAQRIAFDVYLREEDNKLKKAFHLFKRMHCLQAEKHYNEGYILYNDILADISSGYLLGDRICEKHVELFDILYYTPKKTYLIHVKEGFGNTTRDACSQIRVSADLVFRHIICNNSFDILNEFWETVTNTGKKENSYLSAVRDCYNEVGKEGFTSLFEADRKIIYVLAFRDTWKDHGRKVPLVLYPQKKLKSAFGDDFENVFSELLRCQFLRRVQTGKVVITDKVITTTLKDAEDVIKLRTKAMARKALTVLKQSVSSHESFIAKMEVVHLFSYFRQFQTADRKLSLRLHSISKSLPGSSQ